jgi:uncharacterized protein YndB with AHSA1/START domain
MSITDRSVTNEVMHSTLVFERWVSAIVDKVFAAFADINMKSQWGAPSDTAVLIYDTTDFREGGSEHFRCGSKANPNIHGTTHYLTIVQNSRIVSTETIEVDGMRLCVSMTTLELFDDGDRTKLRSTSHVASFIGADMIKGYEIGNNASLDNLCSYFDQTKDSEREC